MAAKIIRLSETEFSISGLVLHIDESDAHLLTEKTWNVLNSGYVARCYWSDGKVHNELLHRVLAGAPKSSVVDHIDGNKLNNRRRNLRICTRAENTRNRKMSSNNSVGLKGVQSKSGRFRATIRADNVIYRLGYFVTAEAAHAAYCEAAARLHGEFARTS